MWVKQNFKTNHICCNHMNWHETMYAYAHAMQCNAIMELNTWGVTDGVAPSRSVPCRSATAPRTPLFGCIRCSHRPSWPPIRRTLISGARKYDDQARATIDGFNLACWCTYLLEVSVVYISFFRKYPSGVCFFFLKKIGVGHWRGWVGTDVMIYGYRRVGIFFCGKK
jgi:hypothetical protein